MSFDLSKVCLASPSFALKTKFFVIKKTGLSGPKFLYWPFCQRGSALEPVTARVSRSNIPQEFYENDEHVEHN